MPPSRKTFCVRWLFVGNVAGMVIVAPTVWPMETAPSTKGVLVSEPTAGMPGLVAVPSQKVMPACVGTPPLAGPTTLPVTTVNKLSFHTPLPGHATDCGSLPVSTLVTPPTGASPNPTLFMYEEGATARAFVTNTESPEFTVLVRATSWPVTMEPSHASLPFICAVPA